MAKDGNKFATTSSKTIVACQKGDFPISAVGLDHGHIFGMTKGLLNAGANLKYVWDKDPHKVEEFISQFPEAEAVDTPQKIYNCPNTKMILSSIIPNERWEIGVQSLMHGKHYMSDKAGFTELSQIEEARKIVDETGLKWSVCFSERLTVEGAIYAGNLVNSGEIGKVVQVLNIAPHRISANTRPDWFFKKKQYGGILCDIGSHQIDQILYYTGSSTATILHSKVGNYKFPQYPELEDFGDCTMQLNSGATGYFRLDWFTPEGLGTWGDGRLFILGTEGYIEVRKYINVTVDMNLNNVILVNQNKKEFINATGITGFPYFSELILDCLNNTDKALPQAHVFETSRLAIESQLQAKVLNSF